MIVKYSARQNALRVESVGSQRAKLGAFSTLRRGWTREECPFTGRGSHGPRNCLRSLGRNGARQLDRSQINAKSGERGY